MQQTNGPHALRVAGRYAKDTYTRLRAWLRQRHPWAIPYIEEEVPQTIAELRARYGKEAGRE